jgi:hypothetical protein
MRLAAAARLLALVSAAFICTHARVDPDLWGHVRFGLDTLRDQRLASIDPYSFTQDIPWVNHEWLSEVAQAVAYRAAGVFGLIALKAILLGAAIALLALSIRRAVEPYRWLLLAAGIVSLAPAAYTMRPQLWTLLCIPTLWWVLQKRRRLVWIPAIFALWVNLHGGWIVGIGVALLWLAGRFVDRRADYSDRPLRKTAASLVPTAVAIAAGVAATLINPYGWRMWTFLLSTVRVTRDITEWRPLWQQEDVSFAVLWLLVAVVIVVPTLMRRRRSISWAGALPAAWLGVMSVFVTRLLPIFGEVAVLGLAQAWTVPLTAETNVDSAPGKIRNPDATAAPKFLIIDAIVAAVVVLANVIPQSRCLAIEGAWTPDLVAAGVFQNPSVGGRLVLPFDWGQYAIWHWGPRLRVSIDGRRETVYSENTLRLEDAVANALPEGIAFLERERPEYLWLQTRRSGALASWLAGNGYRLDVQTAQSVVATRTDLPPLRIGTPMPRCFP